jgi:hypothetical protein
VSVRRSWRFVAKPLPLVVAAIVLPLASCVSPVVQPSPGDAPAAVTSRPPTKICGNTSILDSPYQYDGPVGTFTTSGARAGLPTFGEKGTAFPKATQIVVIPAGDNSSAASTGIYQKNQTIFYFEPGKHIVQTVMYTGDDSYYIGGYTTKAGPAIIDGVNGAAPNGLGGAYLSLSSTGVLDANDSWEYLTIRNFTASQNNAIMGNENGSGFDNGNTYKYDTIGPNNYGYGGNSHAPTKGESNGGGYAIGGGDNTTIEWDCLTQNAQGAFNGGGLNDIISHNEISWNGLGEYPDTGGLGGSPVACGCSGGGKLFFSVNAVVTYNYVHDNYNTGIWLDFDNTGADISYNYVASNWGTGIAYEASYNANISHNTLVGNGWASNGPWPAGVGGKACYGGVSCSDGDGPITGAGGGFPYSALDLANSGGNGNLSAITVPGCKKCAVQSKYSGELLVQDNDLINNFGGVGIYTDTNRYPGNIDNDSTCSIPLGALNQPNSEVYYQETKELYTKPDATISGDQVTTTGGTTTLCSNYGAAQEDSNQSNVPTAPSIGMAVFDQNTGKLLGTVTAAQNAHSFTLSKPAEEAPGAALVLSAYGGCGPADYYGGGLGVKSGTPRANYWDNCIWGSRNITVSANQFVMQQDRITGCTTKNMCGFMIDVAFNAGVPTLVQFFDSYPELIARAQNGLNNVWSGNTYSWTGSVSPGGWQFWAGIQGNQVSQSEWRAAPYNQDAGSKF